MGSRRAARDRSVATGRTVRRQKGRLHSGRGCSLCSDEAAGPAGKQALGEVATMRIEAVETRLARLPLPGGAWRDAIQDVTHIEIVVTDVTSETGLVGTGFSYTGGVGGRTLRRCSTTTSRPS